MKKQLTISEAETGPKYTQQELDDIAEVQSWGNVKMPQKVLKDAEKIIDEVPLPEEVTEQINEVGVETPTKPEVEMVLVNGKHFYQIADETTPYYVSVTTILSALAKGKGFEVWLSGKSQEQQQDILEETSLRGSKVHRAIQLLIAGQQIIPEEFEYKDEEERIHKGLTTEEKNMVNSFVRWWHEFRPKVYASEKIVYNTTYKYAGTLDFIGTIKRGAIEKCQDAKTANEDVFIILDWKTSSGIYPSYEMQLAAYASAEQQMSGRRIERGAILRLGTKHKKGYEFKIIDSLSDSYRAFLGVLAAWKYQNPDFAPKFVELPKLFSLPPIEMVEVKKENDDKKSEKTSSDTSSNKSNKKGISDEMPAQIL